MFRRKGESPSPRPSPGSGPLPEGEGPNVHHFGQWSPLPLGEGVGGEGNLHFDAALALGAFTLDAAFEARAGETVVLVGPSGAGKSLCLSLIAGLLRPDRARIALGERVLCDTSGGVDLPPESRRVGLVFQEYALFPHLTVRENIAYGPRARRRSRKEVDENVKKWVERFGLKAWAGERVGRISGGQRQRVALARALASSPEALLLDEPFSALDVTTRAAVRGEVRAFLKEVGLPTVLVTHDPLDALVFGDRIIVLEDGRITQSGPKEELLMRPRSPFIAELAGLNLYRAEIAAGEGLKEARVGEVVFHVLAEGVSGPAYLAFAPSEVTLASERHPGSAQNVFEGRVKEMLPLPDRLRVLLDVGAGLSAEITREAAAALHLAPGQTLWATVKATAIHVYR
ncbi:MAG: ABC transporter ATP-binding protein [Armatimonadetes bacterium]|nr:ABC transporter ATP-binding protein [Armatimonadota bacterium]